MKDSEEQLMVDQFGEYTGYMDGRPALLPCQHCGNPTTRRLPDNAPGSQVGKPRPECEECAEKEAALKVVPTPPGNCWRCGNPVTFRHSHKLTSGEWECEECAEKGLL